MNFKNTSINCKVYKAETFYEKTGQLGLKCTIATSTKMLSKEKNVYYTQKERYSGIKMFGNEEQIKELVKRLQETEIEFNKNKELPYEEQNKKLGKAPSVDIIIEDIDVINYFFPNQRKYIFKIVVNDWNFKKHPFKKEHMRVDFEKELELRDKKIEKLTAKIEKLKEKMEECKKTLKKKDKHIEKFNKISVKGKASANASDQEIDSDKDTKEIDNIFDGILF